MLLAPGSARGARLGWIFVAASAPMFAAGIIALGRRLTPFPRPLEDSTLVTTGIYRFVRHPLYSGVFLASCGIALLKMTWPAGLLAAALIALLDAKANREEAWLREKFPGYDQYRGRSRKFIPFLF